MRQRHHPPHLHRAIIHSFQLPVLSKYRDANFHVRAVRLLLEIATSVRIDSHVHFTYLLDCKYAVHLLLFENELQLLGSTQHRFHKFHVKTNKMCFLFDLPASNIQYHRRRLHNIVCERLHFPGHRICIQALASD